MTSIDLEYVNSILKDKNNKNKNCSTNTRLTNELNNSMNNYEDYIKNNCSQHETAQVISSNKNLIDKKGSLNTINYQPRQILMVDFGVNCNTFSYKHPCVVMNNFHEKVFVIPCTSGSAPRNKNGEIEYGYCEGTSQDGFQNQTTIMYKEARFIDKTQILYAIKEQIDVKSDGKPKYAFKKINTGLYKKLYNESFDMLFEGKKYIIDGLENQITELTNQITELNVIVDTLKNSTSSNTENEILIEKEIENVNK